MPVTKLVAGTDRLLSMQAWGKVGFSGGYGRARHGVARYGYYLKYAGIYSRRKTLRGQGIVQMDFMRPENPRTALQMMWRQYFGTAWYFYSLLTTQEKEAYLYSSRKARRSIPQLFLREWLRARSYGFGRSCYGHYSHGAPALMPLI